jgi:hypothetical protein
MYTTASKRGKFGKNPGKTDRGGSKGQSHTPSNMYSAIDFGGGKPDGGRRFTGIYGKNAKARNEADVETGEDSRRAGRMYSWMQGDSY